MTGPYVGASHALIAETINALAHDGKLFANLQTLRRIRSVALLVASANPALSAQLDERYSHGCETLSLRITAQLTQQVGS